MALVSESDLPELTDADRASLPDDTPDIDPTGHLESLVLAIEHAGDNPDDEAARAGIEKVLAVWQADDGEAAEVADPTDLHDPSADY